MSRLIVDYITSSGEITSVLSGTAVSTPPLLQTLAESQIEFNGEYPISHAGHYIKDGQALERQPLSLITTNTPLIADGADEVIISGISSGVQVEWPDGQIDIVNDGEVGFKVDLPGFYTFRFTAVPYLDKEVVIEAIPAA